MIKAKKAGGKNAKLFVIVARDQTFASTNEYIAWMTS